jgi:ribonuclease P protein component
MSALLRFSAAMRLSGQRAFARVFARRQTAGNGVIVVHVSPRPENEHARGGVPTVRLGLSVSRRVGGAVERQQWKRAIREAFRHIQHQLPAGYDYVVVVRAKTPPVMETLRAMLLSLAEHEVRRPRGRIRQSRPQRKEST